VSANGTFTMTPPELARYWRVSPDKVLALIKSGQLRAFNVAAKLSGRPRWRISEDAVLAFERARSAVPVPAAKPRPRRSRDEGVIRFF
jgi:excisionase family DNA binding protein